MTKPTVRVHQDPLNGNKWQAQYRDLAMEIWCDIGDACDSREEAVQKMTGYVDRKAAER